MDAKMPITLDFIKSLITIASRFFALLQLLKKFRVDLRKYQFFGIFSNVNFKQHLLWICETPREKTFKCLTTRLHIITTRLHIITLSLIFFLNLLPFYFHFSSIKSLILSFSEAEAWFRKYWLKRTCEQQRERCKDHLFKPLPLLI